MCIVSEAVGKVLLVQKACQTLCLSFTKPGEKRRKGNLSDILENPVNANFRLGLSEEQKAKEALSIVKFS